MKKGGKLTSSRIEFGLDSLRAELEKNKSKNPNKNNKTHFKVSNFLKKKHKKQKNIFRKVKKVKKFHKYKVKTKAKSKKHSINIEFLDFFKKDIKPEIKEKIPSHLFKEKKKILISKEFKKFEEKFRYEFVFFFGLIIAFLGLLPDNKINIFFLFGLSLIFISLFRYHWQKKRKQKDQVQTRKEIRAITNKTKVMPIKELNLGKIPNKTKKTTVIVILLILLIFLISKINFGNLPPNVSIFIITLASIVIILFFLIIVFSKKRKKAIKQGSEIDINKARLIPIQIRKLQMPETYFDLVIEIVNKRGLITIAELAKTFRITKERAEEWANILADHNLITLYYPPIGEPILKKIVKRNEEEEKKNGKTTS